MATASDNQLKADLVALTPATAMLAELVRRYWVLGMECSLLEIQTLAWFLEKSIEQFSADNNPLKLNFVANKYGPYADRLAPLLNSLDGSFLRCDNRISDADPFAVIWFDEQYKDVLRAYLKTDAQPYAEALERTAALIEGFESPFGMELLATVDWLICRENVEPTVIGIREGFSFWPTDDVGVKRKLRLFDKRAISIALDRLKQSPITGTA